MNLVRSRRRDAGFAAAQDAADPVPHCRVRQLPLGPSIGAAAQTGWAHVPERSNMLALRIICWIALKCGRRAARWVLHPISFYFLLFAPTPRRHIKRYLSRAIGPQRTWRDGYRLIYAFAATVLDRIYFLRGRMDLFDVQVHGASLIDAEIGAGRGTFLIGAHFGSFEAIGACKQYRSGEAAPRLAMLMFPDNARQINAVLGALCRPDLRPHVIALGKPHTMLALRDWLDGGGLAGMLADRTLPGPEEQGAASRGNTLKVDFLGRSAPFDDGPFRLAAVLRQRVFFMAGVYLGGARYEVHFELLADFTEPASTAMEREARIGQAVRAYVARLEALCRAHPYNWFNFHDFWLDDPVA